jgi:hypothetical protein
MPAVAAIASRSAFDFTSKASVTLLLLLLLLLH